MTTKGIMYHYVRLADQKQPNLFYLNFDDFRRQLDFFERTFGIVSRAQWKSALSDPQALPEGVILTFDDGLMDHYQYVAPELKSRGLWGIFYVSTDTLLRQNMLNVHRVHYLLGRFGGPTVLRSLEKLLDDSLFIDGFLENLSAKPYTMQSMDESSLSVKKIVNYALKPECKDNVLGSLFGELAGEESLIAQSLYMNGAQICEMADAGFTFGAHGASHNLLTKFSNSQLHYEVTGSCQTLNKLLREPAQTFCYPYGGPDSWNENVLEMLRKQKINYGFCVEPKDILSDDLKERPLTLPRYDCNEFPFGQSRNSQ
jgi:peptidoglycan/xylan/chitin deacetylase (PgdA/CDA1 family)